MKIEKGVEFLASNGLNLYAAFECATLPKKIRDVLLAEQLDLERFGRIILIGNAGKTLWPALQQHETFQHADPVDNFSIAITEQFIADYLDSAESHLLYPSTINIPLQQLGTLAGWHHESPLGLGIHAKYGVWFAYRSAFLTTANVPLVSDPLSPSPCDSCVDKPCLTACPAGAVRGIGRFDVPACAAWRLSAESPCADRCLSRMACPVGQQHMYPLEQIQHHYSHALVTFRKWYG